MKRGILYVVAAVMVVFGVSAALRPLVNARQIGRSEDHQRETPGRFERDVSAVSRDVDHKVLRP